MQAEWLTAAIAAIGILGQLGIGARNAGKHEKQLEDLGESHRRLEDKVDAHDRLLTKHQSQISSIASKCKVLFGPAKWGNGEAEG
jgi:hypothetical protein